MIVRFQQFFALHNKNPSHETALPCSQTALYIKEAWRFTFAQEAYGLRNRRL